MQNITRATYYRDEAELLRGKADKEENTEKREGLLAIARAYDRISAKYLAWLTRKALD